MLNERMSLWKKEVFNDPPPPNYAEKMFSKTFFLPEVFFSFSTSTNLINSNVRLLLRLSQVSCYCVFFGGFRDNFIYYGNLLNNPGYIFII